MNSMTLVPVFVADWTLVLLPVQIAFLELIIDPACSVVAAANLAHLRERRNRTLKWIMGGAGILLVAVLTVPGLRLAFNFGAITFTDWLVAAVAGFIGVAWFEIYKATARR